MNKQISSPFDASSPISDACKSRSERDIVEAIYHLLDEEVQQPDYSEQDVNLLKDWLYYERYFKNNLRNYFMNTVPPCVASAIRYFDLKNRPDQTILDVGSGLGMQSIIFASYGARVVGVDIRESSVELSKKRRAFFEKALNQKLDIEFVNKDMNEFKPDEFGGRFDGVFSMSAFSYIEPLNDTLDLVSSLQGPGSRIFLYEENAQHLLYKMVKKGNIPTPREVRSGLESNGYSCEVYRGGCALPAMFWKWQGLNSMTEALDGLLSRNLKLSINYLLGATKL